jgi:hypothetical protein
MTRTTLAIVLASILTIASSPWGSVHAQSDFLGKAKGLLNTLGGDANSTTTSLAADEIIAGLREALKVGTERVVNTIGRTDGFNTTPDIHIPLPDSLTTVQSTLKRVGMGSLGDELELKLNRAAEAATPKAREIFWQAISSMSVEDAKKILDGPADAATQYFKGQMTDPLKVEMRPVINTTLSEVGAIQAYDAMVGRYESIPFVPDFKANLTEYALDKALDGVFLYLAREEEAIRENPAQRTTDILKKVFGG